ncbi:OsmC family protein [Paeniglutamicibacter cryotolerans]|uniref:Putative OsmC-like protein n=1 Tax=Paeniglutamicibacter cryotolerans TaxID=670079 RepID=A0A839QKU9_9MICC|nr:OsmC family protein [Paeniglutamicibacter cryotolerans]MBB2994656.1 putative OsmC-like protein [Paeniglutamicibacter cryotolerans]
MSETLLEPTGLENLRSARLDAAGSAWSERITTNAAFAALTFTTNGRAEGSVATDITAGKHGFRVDEPAGLAGGDSAPSPVEYALGALISCQVVVYRLYAHQLGIKIDSLEIKAEGDLDVRGLFGINSSVRAGFSGVRLLVNVTGPETRERYVQLQVAVDAHCPVLDLFTNPTPVSVELVTEN